MPRRTSAARPPVARWSAVALVLVALLASAVGAQDDPGDPPGTATESPTTEPTTQPPTDPTAPGGGDAGPPEVTRVAAVDRIATSVAVAQHAFEAAETVVLASAGATADALTGGPLAAAGEGPLLLTAPDALPSVVIDELDRLGADQVLLIGGEAVISAAVAEELAADREVRRLGGATRYETAAVVAEAIDGWDGAFVASGESPVDAVVGAAVAAVQRRPVLLVQPDALPQPISDVLDERDVRDLLIVGGTAVVSDAVVDALADGGTRTVSRVGGATRYATAADVHRTAVEAGLFDAATVWLASGTDAGVADALAAGPAVAATGASLLLVDGAHLERDGAAAVRLREVADRLQQVVLVGGTATITADAPAQLNAILRGPELPGGGRSLLPERRLVALYGSHFSPALGILGEQAPEDVGPRVEAIVGPYRELSDRPVIPTFDLIATIATAHAGADGQYRTRSTDAEIQQWLDAAREVGAYLVLDLQPGRSDFLTEAQAYERFLVEPDVGLALDPEWRTEPPATPGGGTVGSVDASEVNAVSAWLADLVAEHDLPEKLLIIHNFRVDMITNRDQLVDRDGLAVLLHMDGQGRRGTKLDSYRILEQAPPFFNGFKVFLDEDPNPFQPAEVMALDPVPDFISYQ